MGQTAPDLDLRDPHRLALARECLACAGDTIVLLTTKGHETAGFVALYARLEQWRKSGEIAREVRAISRDATEMRKSLDDSILGKSPGEPRLDATLNATVAWMLWRIAKFMLGQHDATVLMWCRMGRAQAQARYAPSMPRADGPPIAATDIHSLAQGLAILTPYLDGSGVVFRTDDTCVWVGPISVDVNDTVRVGTGGVPLPRANADEDVYLRLRDLGWEITESPLHGLGLTIRSWL